MNRITHYICLLLCVAGYLPATASDIVDDAFVKEHLNIGRYSIDTGASAVILFEKEEYRIFTDNKGVLKRKVVVTRVIKLLNEDAFYLSKMGVFCFNDAAAPIEGATYNLVDGIVEKTELKKRNLDRKDIGDGLSAITFVMPQIKRGCIIAYTYQQASTIMPRLCSWHIQGEYPKLESQFSVTCPPLTVEYKPIRTTKLYPVQYKSIKQAQGSDDAFACVGSTDKNGNVTNLWIRRNVSAFKEEPYIANRNNYKEVHELYLVSLRFSDDNTWDNFNSVIWQKMGLGSDLNDPKLFFLLTLDSLAKPGMSENEKMLHIYYYVRNNFKAVSGEERREKNTDLKALWYNRSGTIGEINLLLTSMLLKAKLHANILLISTTEYESPNKNVPVSEQMNYVACAVMVDNKVVFLDASEKYNIPGVLPSKCYNGFAWAVGERGYGVMLDPVLLANKEHFNARVYGFTGNTAKIEIRYKKGEVECARLRNHWAKRSGAKGEYLDELKRRLPKGIEITSETVEHAADTDGDMEIRLSGTWRFNTATDVFSLQHNFAGVFNDNPFTSPVRKFPVEFRERSDYVANLVIELPNNFVPEGNLAPINISNDSLGFGYKRTTNYIPQSKMMTVSSSLNMKRTRFELTEYASLRGFFEQVVIDNSKLLVFKKKVK